MMKMLDALALARGRALTLVLVIAAMATGSQAYAGMGASAVGGALYAIMGTDQARNDGINLAEELKSSISERLSEDEQDSVVSHMAFGELLSDGYDALPEYLSLVDKEAIDDAVQGHVLNVVTRVPFVTGVVGAIVLALEAADGPKREKYLNGVFSRKQKKLRSETLTSIFYDVLQARTDIDACAWLSCGEELRFNDAVTVNSALRHLASGIGEDSHPLLVLEHAVEYDESQDEVFSEYEAMVEALFGEQTG